MINDSYKRWNMKKLCCQCFVIGNPKTSFIKNLTICCTITYYMQQLCEVSNHPKVKCKRNCVLKISSIMKWPSPCFAIKNPQINYIKNRNITLHYYLSYATIMWSFKHSKVNCKRMIFSI